MGKEGETSIIDLEAQWIYGIEDKLRTMNKRSMKTSIFKVPNILRKVDEEAYSPRIVSIGPFHKSTTTTISVLPQTVEHKEDHPQTLVKKHDHLLAMEEHKWWYIIYLLKRKEEHMSEKEANEILVRCGKAILGLDATVRGRYAENIKLQSHQLMEIMLYDGCFILELFLRSWYDDFTEEDPISHNAFMVPALRYDLALLENQIPFIILVKLFEIFVPENKPSIIDLALSFFLPYLNLNKGATIKEKYRTNCSQGGGPLHLLDVLDRFYFPTSPQPSSKPKGSPRFTKCATELLEAGIQFNKEKGRVEASTNAPPSSQRTQKKMEEEEEEEKGEEDHLLEISFSDGVITIPPLMRIDETKKSLLRNLIAYEQCCGIASQHITSYAILMKSLIQSSRDFELLRERKIITNDLSEVEDVLTFFKNTTWEVDPKRFYYGKLCQEVNACHRSCWHQLRPKWQRYKAAWVRVVFQNPWGMITVLALLLTGLQTYYGILSYYPR